MFLDIPDIVFGDWWSVQAVVNQIRFRLGTDASPTYTGITLTGLTASTLIGADADKALESVTIGTGLDYTRPTLSFSHLGIESLTDPNADKILFWDDSETACKWLGVGNSIAITTTTLDTIQDIRTSASPTFTGLTLSGIAAEASDVDKFLVDSTGVIKYRTGAQVLSDIGGSASGHNHDGTYQPLDAGLTSLAGLTYVSDSFIKVTATDTYAIRTIAETKTDLSLNLVENTALSTWVGTTNITTLGTIGTGIWQGTSISTTYTDAKCTATWPNTYTADQNLLQASSPTFAALSLGTGELTCGSINRAADTLTLEINGTPEISITSTTVTLGGNLIIPDSGTIGSASDTDVMTIDSSGNTTFSVFPITPSAAPDADYEVANKKYVDDNAGGFSSGFHAYRGTSNQTITTGTWTAVQLNAEVFDTDNEFDSSTNYRFDAASAGTYIFTGQVQFQQLADGDYGAVGIRVNGTDYIAQGRSYAPGTANPIIGCAIIVELSASDYVELMCYHNYGSDRDIVFGPNITNLSGKRLY